MILGSFVLALYSRKREFRADENSAKLLGKEKMIKAIAKKIQGTVNLSNPKHELLVFKEGERIRVGEKVFERNSKEFEEN